MNFLAIIPARYGFDALSRASRWRGWAASPSSSASTSRWRGVLDDAVVATDDERIYDAVRAFGGRAEMTSPGPPKRHRPLLGSLSTNRAATYDVVVNVQGDEPFIRPSQLEAVKRCFDDPATDIATLVKPFTEADGLDGPRKSQLAESGARQRSRGPLYFSRSVIPYLRGVPREEWLARHTFYKHIGHVRLPPRDVLRAVTALPQSALERAESLEQLRWLENGYKHRRAGISDVETIGIDTPEDLEKAEALPDQAWKIKNRRIERLAAWTIRRNFPVFNS